MSVCETSATAAKLSPWPGEVDLIISAMNAAQSTAAANRRTLARMDYRVRASLRLFSDEPYSPPRILYTCDVNQRGLGFISPQRLPLSHGGILEIIAPNDQIMSVHCTLYRCTQVSPRWYRGAIFFNREQFVFEPRHRMD